MYVSGELQGEVASCGQNSYCEDGECSVNDGLRTVSGELQGVASCCQLSYCQDGVHSLTDGLCTVSGELQGGCQLLSGFLFAKMLLAH